MFHLVEGASLEVFGLTKTKTKIIMTNEATLMAGKMVLFYLTSQHDCTKGGQMLLQLSMPMAFGFIFLCNQKFARA